MAQTPETWHYGLVAKWWAEFNEDGREIAYFQKYIERGQPALDVACGTGRLLIPHVRAGLDVDGCDVSADMIALCREKAEREGLSPTLFAQSMDELDPPRTYKTIFVCGGFGLGSSREQDVEALGRFYENLEPGGTLVLDNENPYSLGYPGRPGVRTSAPRCRGRGSRSMRPNDGTARTTPSTRWNPDSSISTPVEQFATYEMRAGMWRNGELVQEEEHALRINFYFKNELLMMLERAGFTDIVVHGDHRKEAPTRDSDFIVFVTKKP